MTQGRGSDWGRRGWFGSARLYPKPMAADEV